MIVKTGCKHLDELKRVLQSIELIGSFAAGIPTVSCQAHDTAQDNNFKKESNGTSVLAGWVIYLPCSFKVSRSSKSFDPVLRRVLEAAMRISLKVA